MNGHNRFASTEGHKRGGSFARGHNMGEERIPHSLCSPPSPVGLFIMPLGASGAVVKKKQTDPRKGKALGQSRFTRHARIHIQTLLDNPIYAQKHPTNTKTTKL
jgi:hypothetical protein